MLVACEALRADGALGGALLREPPKAGQREPALREELRHEREGEDPAEAPLARPVDAGDDDGLPDAAAARLARHRERSHLSEVGREDGERAAAQERAVLVGDDEVREVRAQERLAPLEHPVLRGVAIDERLHRIDVGLARGTDDHVAKAAVASARATRTRSGAVPPGERRADTDAAIDVAPAASSPNRASYPRRSCAVRPVRSVPLARRSRTIRPTISCASRNGTPRTARWSARSVDASIPCSVARRIASRSNRRPSTTIASASSAGAAVA